ncbi:hypothetical protein B0T18DRAFT_416732 [Schizothecium vesticola]|uniref:Uncharacterized protein n=1 Tax=Schizothecium vesticola TaxID=314040 RepID=A0AA40ERP3_9PEZI|nr:hypothetical protein B0T18DRAFT_416732 [Schizothecium vesticola]
MQWHPPTGRGPRESTGRLRRFEEGSRGLPAARRRDGGQRHSFQGPRSRWVGKAQRGGMVRLWCSRCLRRYDLG